MPKTVTEPTPEMNKRIGAWEQRHRAGDTQWLADLLYRKAERGNRRARRMLSALGPELNRWGATIPEPTWEPVWHPSRREELAS